MSALDPCDKHRDEEWKVTTPPSAGTRRMVALTKPQPLKKASRSALITSAWVVAMPCGKPS
ncbi:hypothetical protein F4V88_16220 [Neorhizobium galegae]|nr:hypothetical protein F4V88_16220 [Neorhizobium galegae]